MIKGIVVSGFRNLPKSTYIFDAKQTVILGPNAAGKTNILEAVHVLSTGKSFRARRQEEMVNHTKDIARVRGKVLVGGEHTELEVVLTRGELRVGETRVEKVPRKKLLVNGVSRRLFNFVGNFRTVIFAPDDLDLVTASPSLRRGFLDNVLSQVDNEYHRALLSYEKGLTQRNKLLYRIREEGISRGQLLFWNSLLIKNGDYISSARQELIDYINNTKGLDGQEFKLLYDKSGISEERLDHYAMEEVAAATTLVGPHRDDFMVLLTKSAKKPRDLARFGSRGEQRMGVFWLKLAELAFIEDKTSEKPTLLLDDIFSELDHEHRKVVMNFVGSESVGQTILTTADDHFAKEFAGAKVIKLV